MKKLIIICIMLLIPINIKAIETSATSAILVDTDSGRILYSKDIHNKRSIASISKIMTAIIAIESNKLNDVVEINDSIDKAYGSGIYIKKGEHISLEDLVYGLMLRSGNDAALAIANYVGGSTEEFVNMMNKLIYARKRLLIPLYENLSIQECDENINRIHALQAELQKMSDKKETLRKLRAQDIIDSIVFNQEMNGLESTSEEYRNEIRNLCSETNDYTELKKLIQFTNREMLTEFTDEIFEKYVSNIVIVNRNTAEFHLKCGLKIKEAL